jgi:hypothetical protein
LFDNGEYKDPFISQLENKNKTLKYRFHNSLESFPPFLLIEVSIVAATSAVTGVCPTIAFDLNQLLVIRGCPSLLTLRFAVPEVCNAPIVCICCKASTDPYYSSLKIESNHLAN